ncbi:MAG: peptide deformylase [Proteobacteria bacterium]|jgi:peptide deformylase|nr:peptide deformylase [Pseudomonadota bacterium]MDA0960801.1 peptide deformylase [Pseudomonadota bacterium]MDA1152152.1 peptide deformylase [Pseudomonadota bacterium]
MPVTAKLIPIIKVPDPVLREIATPVAEITDGTRQLLDDMAATMYDAPGIGLAAPQINISQRIIVMDCGKDESPELFKMINPEIISQSDARSVLEEGCLSIPDQTADVERPAEVEVRYLDENGTSQSLVATGLLAACVQHEIDHLNGVLFIDHISRLKRDMILRRVMKEMRQSASRN